MSGASESAYRHNYEYDPYETAYRPQSRRGGRAQVQLILAILGLVSLGYMLWTIARMLGIL